MPQKGVINLADWKLVGKLAFQNPRADKARLLSYQFSRNIVKTETQAVSVPGHLVYPHWRRAAYVRQLWKGIELDSKVAPLNMGKVLVLSELAASYQLEFDAVPWLPNLKITVWEYQGGWEAGDFNADDGEVLDDGEF